MRAYVYTRHSPRPDKDCDSCEKQAHRCIDFCNTKGLDSIAYPKFWDESISGTDVERPALNILISTLTKEKEKCAVVIDSPDRLARDTIVGLVLRERITRAGGLIRYADGSPSGETPEQKCIATVMLAFATLERDRVSYRTSRGLKKRQAAGEFFGKPAIGWGRLGGKGTKLVPCENERKAVIMARSLFFHGWSSSAVAQRIQDTLGGFRGGSWKAKTVRKMSRKIHGWEKKGEEDGE